MFESFKYLTMDLKALHEVLRVMNRNIFLLFKLQMTKSITITSLALKILYTNFNNDKLLLPHILNKDIYQEIKKVTTEVELKCIDLMDENYIITTLIHFILLQL